MVRRLHKMLPALPVGTSADSNDEDDGGYYLKYGEYCSRLGNIENTELYALHPFHLLSVNQASVPDLLQP